MVFNKDVLFIHLGKTGGMSVTDYLCNTLKPPVYHVLPQSHLERSKPLGYEQMIPGNRHGNLSVAQEIIAPYNLKLSDFRMILIVVRNPLDLHFSYFKHLAKPHVRFRLQNNPKNLERLEAALGTFEDFVLKQFVHYRGKLINYFEMEGKRPENLKIVRFEEMSLKIPELVRPYTINDYPFPHRNKSPEKKLSTPLGDEALLSIRNKYEYICKNFYPDLKLPEKSGMENTVPGDKKLLFTGGCGRSGTSSLTEIIGSHQQIVLGIERYNKLMRKNAFSLSKAHFTKERFLTIQNGDTFYDDFNKLKAHHGIAEKFDDAVFVGIKYPPFDQIFHLMKEHFGSFKYLYIYRNIIDVAELWNRRAEKGINWPKHKNYLKAVERWNQSLKHTFQQLKNGADIICIHYDDLLFSEKSIQPIFDRLGIPIDENVLSALANARKIAPEKKSAKGTLTENEIEYIKNNARFEWYDEIHSKYNILG
jgi:hypothetical protein